MFADRFEITGTLTLDSALHIGCGNILPKRETDSADAAEPSLSLVCRAEGGRPIIPGTSLKGALRALLPDPRLGAELFGMISEHREEAGQIGRLWLRPAPWVSGPDDRALKDLRRAGDRARPDAFTRARTRIDRVSGTAEEHLLFNAEVLPPGATFTFNALWFVDDAAQPSQREMDNLVTVLRLLTGGISLGRGSRTGDGRLHLLPQGLKLTGLRLCSDTGELIPIDTATADAVTHRVYQAMTPPAATVEAGVKTLRFACDGPFISVKERQRGRVAPGQKAKPIEPLCCDGKPMLWPTSVLGGLRARAAWLAERERLQEYLRKHDYAPGRSANADLDDRNRVVRTLKDVKALSSVERLFGVTGWRGRLAIRSVKWVSGVYDDDSPALTSVSIDRFTGGGRDGALFTTKTVLDPVFDVSLAIERSDCLTPADHDLFELLIEDLTAEGNVLFLGHGAAKGFGWFTVTETAATGGTVNAN
ncbi:MAG: RAMP superfamily CRISPR-associated protein [Defluviicoccus sp.]